MLPTLQQLDGGFVPGESVDEALQMFQGNEAALERRQELFRQASPVPGRGFSGVDKRFKRGLSLTLLGATGIPAEAQVTRDVVVLLS